MQHDPGPSGLTSLGLHLLLCKMGVLVFSELTGIKLSDQLLEHPKCPFSMGLMLRWEQIGYGPPAEAKALYSHSILSALLGHMSVSILHRRAGCGLVWSGDLSKVTQLIRLWSCSSHRRLPIVPLDLSSLPPPTADQVNDPEEWVL